MRFFLFFCIASHLFSARIAINDQVLEVKIAKTPEERAKGLMGKKSLPEGTGMLFVYPQPEKLCFWMKNTSIPLSIAFFNEKKELLNILNMSLPDGEPLPTYHSKGPALYALEVSQGWFQKHGITPPMRFSFLDPEEP